MPLIKPRSGDNLKAFYLTTISGSLRLINVFPGQRVQHRLTLPLQCIIGSPGLIYMNVTSPDR